MRLRPRNVRTRLTLWYLGVLAAILALFTAGTGAFLFFQLREDLDREIAMDLESIERPLSEALQSGTKFHEVEDPDAPERFLEAWSSDGRLLYRSDRLGTRALGGPPTPEELQREYLERSATLAGGTRVRIASGRMHGGARPLVRIAHSEEPVWREFRELLSVMLLGFPVALALAGLGGYALARRALAPIDGMALRAEQISADRLNERLPVENPEDELGHLARAFNGTLSRLEESFEQLRRFTADASHELRTPLTAIRSVGEVGLQQPGGASYYRDIIGSMLEEVNRLTRLVESLLTISRADSGHVQLQRANLSLLDLARESAGLLEVLAEEKREQLVVEGDARVVVAGDRLILRQALLNLIDNAIKYSPEGEKVLVRVAKNDGDATLEVIDRGSGIPAEHHAKLFERFYRVDKARSREAGGAGLGLSIAQWAVQVHGGTIQLFSQDGGGCTFRIVLPAADTKARTT